MENANLVAILYISVFTPYTRSPRMHKLASSIDHLNHWLGKGLGWLTLTMVLLTFFIVILRYFFSWGSIALQELVMYMHALVFMGGAAYALQHDEHVRVDIFYREMSEKRKAWVNLIGTIFLLIPVCGLMLWLSLEYVGRAWLIREASPEPGGLAFVYLLKTMIPLMAGLLLLQGISQILHSILTLRKVTKP